jgi:hypothetical protein
MSVLALPSFQNERVVLTVLWDPLCNAVLSRLATNLYSNILVNTYHTTRGISASMASSMPAAAKGGLSTVSANPCNYDTLVDPYGMKMAEAVAPVSFIASLTLPNTGLSKCVCPAFLGFMPPTTFVPGE